MTGRLDTVNQSEMGTKRADRIEPERAGSCQEMKFVLVKLAAIWSTSELVLEVIFIAAFIAWQACTAPVRECLLTCQCHSASGEE